MKKLLFGLAIAAISLSFTASAQSTKLVTKNITGADTITWNPMPSKLKSFSYVYTETGSVTTAGKVYLEGSNISGAWQAIDSLVLADVSTAQIKTVLIPTTTGTAYLGYRWRSTNTTAAAVKAAYLRRTDE